MSVRPRSGRAEEVAVAPSAELSRPLDRMRLLGLPRRGRRAVVVGGGQVAARRAAALTRASTPVTVFAPSLCDDVFDLLAERLVTWEDRWPVLADLDDAWLVHAASGDPRVDAQVCALAARLRRSRG